MDMITNAFDKVELGIVIGGVASAQNNNARFANPGCRLVIGHLINGRIDAATSSMDLRSNFGGSLIRHARKASGLAFETGAPGRWSFGPTGPVPVRDTGPGTSSSSVTD